MHTRSVENKILNLIEETTTKQQRLKIKKCLREVLKNKWHWELTPDIEEKFFNRFENFKINGDVCEAYDSRKRREVILDKNSKAFIIVKETKRPCGFLNGAVRASKNKKQL